MFSFTGLLPSMAILSRSVQLTTFTYKLSPDEPDIFTLQPQPHLAMLGDGNFQLLILQFSINYQTPIISYF